MGRWDSYEWFLAGLDNLREEANRAKDLTQDSPKKERLDGYIECAAQMRVAVIERWEEEAKKCAECDKPMLKRNAKKFCSDRCREKFNNRSDKKSKSDILAK